MITTDGCWVEAYRLLPPDGEAEVVHEAVPSGAEVLDLGCGTGRIAHRLLELGHPVTAVDDSAGMLEHVRGATTVRARIEELRLRRRFEAVLLASHLVNAPDSRPLLAAVARHLSTTGRAVFQWHPPEWFETVAEGAGGVLGEVSVRLSDIVRGAGTLSATVHYEARGQQWSQPFVTRQLSDTRLGEVLSEAGLRFEEYRAPDRTWFTAVPAARRRSEKQMIARGGRAKIPRVSQTTLRTARIDLVPLSDEHLEHEVELDADPEVMRYLGPPRTREQVEDAHRRRLAVPAQAPGLGFWAGFVAGDFVGWWLLEPPARPDQGPADGQAELGYRLSRRYWRQGLASEGARELIRHGFADLGLRRIFAETMTVNAGSRATMAAVGMRYVRTFHLDWDDPVPGIEQGEVEYEITREQWLATVGARTPGAGTHS